MQESQQIVQTDGDEQEYLYQSSKCSYNYHMDGCNGIFTLGLVNVSYMSIFNAFDKTVTYDRDMFHGRIIDDFFSMTTEDFTDNHESTLGSGTNDLGNDIGAQTNLYSGQVEGAFGLFGNSFNTGNNTSQDNWFIL